MYNENKLCLIYSVNEECIMSDIKAIWWT